MQATACDSNGVSSPGSSEVGCYLFASSLTRVVFAGAILAHDRHHRAGQAMPATIVEPLP